MQAHWKPSLACYEAILLIGFMNLQHWKHNNYLGFAVQHKCVLKPTAVVSIFKRNDKVPESLKRLKSYQYSRICYMYRPGWYRHSPSSENSASFWSEKIHNIHGSFTTSKRFEEECECDSSVWHSHRTWLGRINECQHVNCLFKY